MGVLGNLMRRYSQVGERRLSCNGGRCCVLPRGGLSPFPCPGRCELISPVHFTKRPLAVTGASRFSKNDRERQALLEILKQPVERFDASCLALCLMPNHCQFRTGEAKREPLTDHASSATAANLPLATLQGGRGFHGRGCCRSNWRSRRAG
jgi:hypothetical protein